MSSLPATVAVPATVAMPTPVLVSPSQADPLDSEAVAPVIAPAARALVPGQEISVREFQSLIREMFGAKDAQRGIEGTFLWLMEEVGELASALRSGPRDNLELEFADVLAWLVTIANVAEVDLTAAIHKKYGAGCPGCLQPVCNCGPGTKP